MNKINRGNVWIMREKVVSLQQRKKKILMPQISKATEYNWKRLDCDLQEKLTRRANKTQSMKRVVASNYLNYAPANRLLDCLLATNQKIEDVMYSLCLSCLRDFGIAEKENVKTYFSAVPKYRYIDMELPTGIWDSGEDVLGFIYQSLITEGERNSTGQYYTHKKVVEYMLNGKRLADEETFLDPCCGSGSFLLSVKTNTPSSLYGFDINPIAVMIAATNLLVKYAEHDFLPNVYCIDFLHKDLWSVSSQNDIPHTFDNIYTNPPWGADKQGKYTANYTEIKSKERSSMVIVESLARLAADGTLCFLLPTSLLKIKSHADIRKYILSHSAIKAIDMFANRFDGVFTDFFSIRMERKSNCPMQTYDVTTGKGVAHIQLSETDRAKGEIVLEQLSSVEESIIEKLESRRHDDLKHSKWALGIVTGDNKGKVKKERATGMEPVYAGKQVRPFKLTDGTSYISFVPEEFQQCAKEEFFRAPEKLIYRFIAKYPIVAYDDKQCLCLNSANILIPDLDGISIKSAAALLNSTLYHYYYTVKFSDIKVLKGNLQALPFPKLTERQNEELCNLVSSIQSSDYSADYQRKLDDAVYSIFSITPTEQAQIEIKIK